MYKMTLHGVGSLTVACKGAVCYGADGTGFADAEIQRMQRTLNRFAPTLKITPILVDRLVGEATVNLARKVVEMMVSASFGALQYASLIPTTATKQSVAESASRIADAATEFADAHQFPTKVVAPAPSTPSPSQIPSSVPGEAQKDLPDIFSTSKPSPKSWYLAGGLVLTAIAVAIVARSLQSEEKELPSI